MKFAVLQRQNKGCLREIHFLRDILHPDIGGWSFKHTNARRIPEESFTAKCIDLINAHELIVSQNCIIENCVRAAVPGGSATGAT
jgi:hypothetical protein